jgi:hypothetical protein
MSIDNDGYIIIKNILTPEQLQKGLLCDNHGKVNYRSMKKFIDSEFLPTIKKNTSFMKDPVYVKFRYSNNNNSTDASTFHSDVYNYTSSETIPIYTCLCYFDKTQMELIPGSHKKEFQSINNSIQSFFTKKVVDIHPGDILVFHANLYHRGINYNTGKDRRILQVFEVFPDKNIYHEKQKQLLTVVTSKKSSMNILTHISYLISKVPVFIDSVTFLHYILVYNDLQYKIVLNDISPDDKKNRLVTYEPSKRMNYSEIHEEDDININIICEDTPTIEPSNYYLYLLLSFIVFIIIIYLLFSFYKSQPKLRKSMTKRSKRKV